MTEEAQYRTLDDDDEAFRMGPLVDVADGEHPATLVNLGRMQVTWDGEPRDRVRWDFGILDAFDQDDAPALVSGWTSTSTGEKSTARRWIAALAGPAAIAVGVILRKSDLVGRGCRVIVVHDQNGYPKVDLVLAPSPVPVGAKARADA